MSKARDLSDFISVATVDASEIADLAITHAKLHTDMNLSSKTVTLPSAITNTITNKLPLAGGTLTGALTAPSVLLSTSAAKIAEFNSTHANHGYIVLKEDGTDKFYIGASTAVSGQSAAYTFYASTGLGLDFNTGGVGSPRMRIDSSGNIGIGMSSPQRQVVLYSPTASGQTNLQFQNSTTGTAAGDGFGVGMDSNEKGFIWNYESNDTYIGGTTGGTSMTIAGSTGNVGIGTTSPTRALTVASTGDTHINTTSSHANGYSMFVSENSSDANNSWGVGRWHDGRYVISHNAAATWSQTGDTERLVIDTSGNVGIGVTAPSDKLDIQGADNGLTIRSASANRPMMKLINGSSTMLTISANGTYAAIGDGSDANKYMSFKGSNVGIGTTAPDSLLHLQKTRGTISGGSVDTGAVIKLHTTAQFESGYNSSATDFLGALEFSSDDTSGSGLAGAGVRAAVRAYVADAYNNVGLSFETGGSRAERMRIDHTGKIRIGGTDAITSQLTLGDTSDPDKITMWSPGAGARSERTKYLSLTVRPLYTANQYYRLNLGAASYGTGATVRYQATFSTGHASGHGYCEGVATFYAHHSLSKQYPTGTSGNPHISYARMYGNGSYYGWTTYPDIRFYLCNATGNSGTAGAAIYIQTSGHGSHNSSTYDLYCDIQLDLQVMNSDYNADPLLTAVGSSTPSDIGSQLGCTFLS